MITGYRACRKLAPAGPFLLLGSAVAAAPRRAYDAAMVHDPAPRLNDITRRVTAALKAGKIVLPAMADDLPGIQAFPVEGGPVQGLGIVGDGRALRILVLTVEEARGTAEYIGQHANFLALFRSVDDRRMDAAASGEVFLEEVIHEFLHDAYEAWSLGLFLRRKLLPQLIEIWALIDAYSLVVHGKLPGRGDRPLIVTRDMVAGLDPYAEGGLILAMQIWHYAACEMHDSRVHFTP
jgi:hypothetical protein